MNLRESLQRVTTLLVSDRPATELWPEIQELAGLFVARGSESIREEPSVGIGKGETWTENGLAVSPTMASMCLDDYMRTIQFLRGTHDAIDELSKKRDRPVRVLYAGCGPHATLAVPLMSLFASDQVVFTLVDIHSVSLQSAQKTVERFGFADSVTEYRLQDVSSMELTGDKPDIILTEVMQARLQKEPQVAVTRHLLAQAPDAILVPQEVRVELQLIDPSQFSGSGADFCDPISLGSVFVLNRDVHQMTESDGCLPAATIQLPDSWDERLQLMLTTEIQTYNSHRLTTNQSGLTCPRLYTDPAEPGASVDFSYQLGDNPKLLGKMSD